MKTQLVSVLLLIGSCQSSEAPQTVRHGASNAAVINSSDPEDFSDREAYELYMSAFNDIVDGNYRGAERKYRQGFSSGKDSLLMGLGLAIAICEQGRHESAMAKYRVLQRAFPTKISVFTNSARCLSAQGKYNEVIDLLNPIIQLYDFTNIPPENEYAYLSLSRTLANAHLQLGQCKIAEGYLRQAIYNCRSKFIRDGLTKLLKQAKECR